MHKNDVIGGGIFTVVGAAVFLTTLGYPRLDDNHPGPGLFPQVLALLAIGFGLKIIYNGFKPKAAAADADDQKLTLKGLADPFTVLALITIYMLISDFLGFFISSSLVMAIMMLRLKVTPWKGIVISLAMAIVINLVFSKLLRVPLPVGLFSL